MDNQPKFVGIVACVPRGEWQNSITYNVLNIVRYNGASYMAKSEVPINKEPSTNPSYWQLIVQDGTGGSGSSYDDTEIKQDIQGLKDDVGAIENKTQQLEQTANENKNQLENLNQAIDKKASQEDLEEVEKKVDDIDLTDYVKFTDRDNFVKGGVTENSITLTDEEKVKALAWLGAVPIPTNWAVSGLMFYDITKGELKLQRIYQAIPGNTAGAVPQTKTGGRITTNDPTEPLDCVNKQYLESALANAGGKLYRYHIKLHILNGMIPIWVEFDTFSQNADLFSNDNTAIENYNILHSLYASEKIPVVYKCSFDGYNVEGAVSLTFNASSNGYNEIMGGGYDIDRVSSQYIIDGFSSSQISTFEFTRFEQ